MSRGSVIVKQEWARGGEQAAVLNSSGLSDVFRIGGPIQPWKEASMGDIQDTVSGRRCRGCCDVEATQRPTDCQARLIINLESKEKPI